MPNQKELALKTLWILWGVLTYTVLIYGLIGYLLQRFGSLPPQPEFLGMLTQLFAGLGIAETFFLFFAAPRFLAKAGYTLYCIIRWSCAEAIAIYGLILFVLAGPWLIFGSFLGWAFALFLLLMPTQSDQDRYLGT